jgi:hypothetical protein
VARTQDVWGAEGISGRVKFLLLAWAGMPKTSFCRNSDSPHFFFILELTLNRDYFRLRKPIERRIYEIARKHCGRKKEWSIGLALLHKKPLAWAGMPKTSFRKNSDSPLSFSSSHHLALFLKVILSVSLFICLILEYC